MPDKDCLNQRIAKMEDEIENHHTTLESHDRRLSDLTSALHENTALTKQIAENTSELVELFKGAKMFRKFFLWAAPFGAVLTLFWDSLWFKK